MVIPLKGQYEQKCNAAALEKFNVSIIENMDENFYSHFEKWIENVNQLPLSIEHNTEEIIEVILSLATKPLKDTINVEDFSINDSILNRASWMNLREAN
jgi:hypothetical protein